ncbi:MAG: hypothetical protein L6R36_003850 [Xanthoria steineri]|nr:MAG: hypothetical protein L6R36_003850 [Xanthoria steineri]
MSEQTLSKRSQQNLPAGASFEKLIQVLGNSYGDNNLEGIVSLGVAENGLMHEELAAYFNKLEFKSSFLTYGDGPFGSRALRSALSSFFNDYFNPVQKVLPEQLLVAGGVTSVIDLVTVGVADEGDGILIGRPLYTSFKNDVRARAGARMVPVSAQGKDPMSEEMVAQYEKELQKQERQGIKIRAIILSSPHNPLGKCYSIDALKAYMRFCQRYRLHLISDEVYAMSIYKTPSNASAVPFTSVLAIDTTNLIDANLVHILYGMSKDFSSNGLRGGILLSQHNPPLLSSLKSIAIFSWPASTTENYWTALLTDRPFLDSYFAENRRRLAAGYARLTSFFTAHGIGWVEGSNAGFFLWADFRGLLGADIGVVGDDDGAGVEEKGGEQMVEAVAVNEKPAQGQVYKTSRRAKERDEWFFGKLMAAKVYVATGDAFFAEEHGWYRVSFSVPEPILKVGLERLGRVLEEVKEDGGAR